MGEFYAGASRIDITVTRDEQESKNERNYYSDTFPGGPVSPLYVRTLITINNEDVMVIISLDLCATPKKLADRIRKKVSEELGVGVDCIAVCSTHTHSSPVMFPDDWSYTERLVHKSAETARKAYDSIKPASIGAIKGYCNNISYNRCYPITEVTPKEFYPNEKHLGGIMFARDPFVGRCSGEPVDNEVGAILLSDKEENPIAVVYNFSCHPATCIEGNYMHGDFPGFASKKIEEEIPCITALFLQGSAGSTNPVKFFGTWEDAKELGEKLALEVLRIIPDITLKKQVKTFKEYTSLPISLIEYDKDEIRRFLKDIEDYEDTLHTNPEECWFGKAHTTVNLPPKFNLEQKLRYIKPMVDYCKNQLKDKINVKLKPLDHYVQIFSWNDIALCMHSLELFCETGFEIKRLSPLRYTFPVSFANGNLGYLPPKEKWKLGGYWRFTFPMFAGFNGMLDCSNISMLTKKFLELTRSSLGNI
ncbi:hypothetical protein C4577_06325 [Candidatus Parcubacteria bacterium]|nr:MAG: hypothetical protein C4577_06325 [Candidatus Parcubacteria bacterium]